MKFLHGFLTVTILVSILVYIFVLIGSKAQRTYFKYLWRHKCYVFLECALMAFPKHDYNNFRLFWLGIIHDWRKYLPYSYIAYAENFYGESCLPGGLEEKRRKKVFMNAMRAHMKVSKHHWSHWCFIGYKESIALDAYIEDEGPDIYSIYPLVPCDMPEIYIMEMIADWAGAGRAINGKVDPFGWYTKMGDKMKFTDSTHNSILEILEDCYVSTE